MFFMVRKMEDVKIVGTQTGRVMSKPSKHQYIYDKTTSILLFDAFYYKTI